MRRLALLCCVVVAGGAAALFYGWLSLTAAGPLYAPRAIVVPRGGLRLVAAVLADNGVIGSRIAFELAAEATALEGPIKSGELNFPSGASLRTVLAVLRSGVPVQHKITIAEGLTAAQISRILAAADGLSGDVAVPQEGAMLPNTYIFDRGAERAAIIARATAAMRAAVAAGWRDRAPGLPLRDPNEAIVLASMVEKEARLAGERPMIARVFINRLTQGMRLQSDPTAAYGASGGLGHLDHKLDHADLERADHYNTYVVAGLPEGPICSPGVASINAALHPADGTALYFVADGSGGHLFSTTIAAHNANVAHLRAVQRP